jgi:hypothetical protein
VLLLLFRSADCCIKGDKPEIGLFVTIIISIGTGVALLMAGGIVFIYGCID